MDRNGSKTARLCLFARAVHAQEEHPVFRDTKAGELLSEEDYETFRKQTEEMDGEKVGPYDERQICRQVDCWFSPILTSRSSYAEDHVKAFVRKYGKIQYVILGAGMDTFAFRDPDPSIEVFELDHPYTQNYKKKRIKELGWQVPPQVHYAEMDFTKDSLQEVLARTPFVFGKPTVFSILGITYYLSRDTLTALLAEIAGLMGKEDELIFDYPDRSGFASSSSRMHRLSEVTEEMGEKMSGGFTTGEIEKILAGCGLQVKEHLNPQMIEERWFAQDERIRAFPCIHLMMSGKAS